MNLVHQIAATAQTRSDLAAALASRGWTETRPPHTFWQFKGPDITVTLYSSGKLMLQGHAANDVWDWLRPQIQLPLPMSERPAPPSIAAAARDGQAAQPTARVVSGGTTAMIGSDEVGKGDYFGPLIVCAAAVLPEHGPLLQRSGVTDSKKLSDERCLAIAAMLNELPHAFAERMPEAYNAHWGKLKNVNRVLDELHAQAITEVHRATGILDAITDQYAADGRLKSRLPRELRWRSETGGESWTAVAVASVFARARFVQRMQELESQWGMRLNKGAGSPTFADARRFVTVHGFDKLSQVAKLHFRTTEQLRPRA